GKHESDAGLHAPEPDPDCAVTASLRIQSDGDAVDGEWDRIFIRGGGFIDGAGVWGGEHDPVDFGDADGFVVWADRGRDVVVDPIHEGGGHQSGWDGEFHGPGGAGAALRRCDRAAGLDGGGFEL